MPRAPRIDFANARHHVYNRGARKDAIFKNDADCVVFLSLLGQCQLRFGTRVHAYALMGNHFHLLVSTPRGNLSHAMAFLQSRYARHLNREHSWDGPIFTARFRNRVVGDPAYWQHLLAYLHLNPVKAHLIGQPEDARWTSHRSYVGLDPVPDWLETAELLELFGSAKQLRDYVYEVQIGRREGPVDFAPDKLWTPLATDTVPKPQPRRTAGAKRTRRSNWPGVVAQERALAEVARVTGVPVEDVLKPKKGRGGSPIRLLAMWWLAERSALGTNAVARTTGCTPPVVSRALNRVRESSEPQLVSWRGSLVKLAK